MAHTLSVEDDTRSLDELIEAHLQALFAKLACPHTIDELEAEVARLNDLIQSYKLRDELLERLLDSATPEEKLRQVVETLRAMRVKVGESRAEQEQLHAKSHQLMERSALLIKRAQEEIVRRKKR
jgi:hypothetical protein